MLTASVARRYARALFELARERGQVEAIGRDLEQVVRTLESRQDLRALWEHQEVSPRVKQAMIRQEFGDKVSELVLNFLAVVTTRRREAWLGRMLAEYTALADEALGQVEVEVRSAAPLPIETLAELKIRLGQRLGKEVRLTQKVDPDLLGGVVLRVGDVLMDGSVRTQLKRMKERLAAASGGAKG